MTYITKNKFLH